MADANSGTVSLLGFQGCAEEWESIGALRARVRQYSLLVICSGDDPNAYVCKNTANTKLNAEVLSPLLHRMGMLDGTPLPAIDALQEEVKEYFTLCNVHVSVYAQYQQAWALRRMLQLVKSWTFRPNLPKDTWF